MNLDTREFLQQSNYIEGEYSDEALEDACDAWSYLIKQDELTKENILETHRILMERCNPQHVPIGKFRDYFVSVGGRVCPGHTELESLFNDWLQAVYILEESIREDSNIVTDLHVKFEKIHPFGDGNGRVGRIILNWQRVKAGLDVLVIKESERFEYYKWFK